MTTMGHSLTGLSIGVLLLPGGKRWWWLFLYFNALVALSNISDWPFSFWGHTRYEVSHSLFVTLGLVVALGGALGSVARVREALGGWRALIAGGLAWVGHLLLDTLYNHGHGLKMFWPLSDGALALPLPWFSTLREAWIPDAFTARVLLTEAAFYGGVLVVCIALRALWWRRARVS